MPQTKRKKGKGKGRGKASAAQKSLHATEEPSSSVGDGEIDGLLDQARTAGDPFLSVELYKKALLVRSEDIGVMEEAAELMLHVGETTAAKELNIKEGLSTRLNLKSNIKDCFVKSGFSKVLGRSISLEPEEGPDKYLYMAQLHQGREALNYYEKGLELLEKKLVQGAGEAKGGEAALKQRLCMAYCSVGELFLTDLCFEDEAEKRCQDALDRSMLYDYGGPEPLHALANLRLSQSNPDEGVQLAEQAFERLCLCEPPPDQEFRVSLAKILMECSTVNATCSEKALEVLSVLMQEDDENVEVWYLMAVAFNSLQRPDLESARAHLNTAAEMLSKIRAAHEEMGEEFAFEEQVQLVQEQLEITARAEEEDANVRKKSVEGDKETDMSDGSSLQDDSNEMDCV